LGAALDVGAGPRGPGASPGVPGGLPGSCSCAEELVFQPPPPPPPAPPPHSAPRWRRCFSGANSPLRPPVQWHTHAAPRRRPREARQRRRGKGGGVGVRWRLSHSKRLSRAFLDLIWECPCTGAHWLLTKRATRWTPGSRDIESQKSRKRSHFWMSELLSSLLMSGDRCNKTLTLLLDILFTDVYLWPVGLERCAETCTRLHEVYEHGANARNGAVTSCGSPSLPKGLKTMRLSRIFST